MNSKLKAGIILLIVFALGVMSGIAGLRLVKSRPLQFQGLDPFRMEKGVIDRIEKRLVDRFELSADQRVAVRQILMNSQKKYNQFFHETRPTFEEIRRDQREAIREVMTPVQLKNFDAWLEERRKHHAAREGVQGREEERHRPIGPPPPPKDN